MPIQKHMIMIFHGCDGTTEIADKGSIEALFVKH